MAGRVRRAARRGTGGLGGPRTTSRRWRSSARSTIEPGRPAGTVAAGALPSDGGTRITGWGLGTGRSYHDPDGPLHHARRPCPEGEEKVRGRPVDVRRHRAALRPREPDHDVPHGRRLAAADGRARSACPPASTVLDLACGTGDLCRELAAAGSGPIGVDLSLRDAGRRPHRRAARARRRAAAPVARRRRSTASTCGFALRNFVDLAPFFAELARVVRPGGRIALLEVAEPPNRLLRCGPRRLLRQGRAADRRAAVRPRRVPLPAAVGRLPARAGRDARRAGRAPGSTTVDRRLLSDGHRPADHRHRDRPTA